jgi:prophage regulatory protein
MAQVQPERSAMENLDKRAVQPAAGGAIRGRVVRLPELQQHYLPLSRVSIWRLTRTDPDFPRPIRLGARAIGFDLDAVLSWLRARGRSTVGEGRVG